MHLESGSCRGRGVENKMENSRHFHVICSEESKKRAFNEGTMGGRGGTPFDSRPMAKTRGAHLPWMTWKEREKRSRRHRCRRMFSSQTSAFSCRILRRRLGCPKLPPSCYLFPSFSYVCGFIRLVSVKGVAS